MDLKLSEFDRDVFDLSKIWLKDSYIRTMICAPDTSEEDQNNWFDGLKNRSDYKIWAVVVNGTTIGASGVKNIKDDTCEYFGYIGNSEYRKKGFGKQMLLSTIKYAKILYGIRNIRLKVLHNNEPAIKLYHNNGFIEYDSDEKFSYMILTE